MKIKRKTVRFIDSVDPEFGEPVIEPETCLFAEDITAEYKGYDELTFRVMLQPLAETDYDLDLWKCRIFRCGIEGDLSDEDLNWLLNAKFVDVIRRYAR
ncbi:hypothetical protein [Cytobacillus kochii]|uniref:hypothetical protein n=1 Tax=Cytobacillus kochii TaxID=859143 RepID=UPI001CD5B186|nr:hypothetical protein [Cytobacillus kochii]MCA1027832.1 hypothetical protein [Cytobacillus kochii]